MRGGKTYGEKNAGDREKEGGKMGEREKGREGGCEEVRDREEGRGRVGGWIKKEMGIEKGGKEVAFIDRLCRWSENSVRLSTAWSFLDVFIWYISVL